MRLRNQLKVSSAKVGDQPATVIQEDWEGGFTVLLPQAAQAGQTLTVEVTAAGEFIRRIR